MKKLVSFLCLVLVGLVVVSCASPAPVSQSVPVSEPAPVSQPTPPPAPVPTPAPTPVASFEPVYTAHQDDLILDGATSYEVKEGDTLSAISSNAYGYGYGICFPIIMLASREVVQDPDLIEPGMILTIPDLQRNLDDPSTHQKLKSYLLDIAGVYDQKARPGYSMELRQLVNSF